MSNTKLTMHSKVRFSQRVDYREFIEETVEKVLKYGVRLDDIPIDKIGLRKYMRRSRIYYKGRIYVFDEQLQYNKLVTIFFSKNKTLEEIFQKKEDARKRDKYREMMITYSNLIFSIVLYDKRVCEVKIIPSKKYRFNYLKDEKLRADITRHFIRTLKGKYSFYDLGLYLEELSDLDKKVYKKVLEIPYGKTMNYKLLANDLKISTQKLTRILNNCTIPILIPTHRVIKSNGNVGSYFASIDLKKLILRSEQENINKIKLEIEDNVIEESEGDYLSFSLSDLIKKSIK